MPRLVCDITVSLDGFAAGPAQSESEGLGVGGEELHRWMFETPEENTEEIGAQLSAGAYIMGRNMYTHERGDWSRADWVGWWGPEPPFGAPVFVLTHHPKPPLQVGRTRFTFVTEGPEAAYALAMKAAGGENVGLLGGAHTIRQFLNKGLLDELRLHIAPIFLGDGERLFEDLNLPPLRPLSSRTTSLVTHVTYEINPPRKS